MIFSSPPQVWQCPIHLLQPALLSSAGLARRNATFPRVKTRHYVALTFTFEEGIECAERLHTFGRGVDAAWADGKILDEETANVRLRVHGALARPRVPLEGIPCRVRRMGLSIVC